MEKREQQSQWISVDDKLPDVDKSGESEYVLVRYKDCIPIVAQYCTEEFHCCPSFKVGRKTFVSNWIDTNSNWVGHEITHWMPIPSFDEILENNKDIDFWAKENLFPNRVSIRTKTLKNGVNFRTQN